ncbi:MAG: response regulator, partial [Alkaliphilus sp.]|nr:response regulator [Alkaliphilus sp.]
MVQKLLIVDDEPVILKGLKYSLEQESYIVETAVDGENALSKALNNVFDLIVLDLMLPGMDGLEVCQKIRKN